MKAAVKDVMTTRVIWVRKNASFKEMATVLRGQRVSAFPVLDARQGDQRRLRSRLAGQGRRPRQRARSAHRHPAPPA
jgi:CBS domain-containing protein